MAAPVFVHAAIRARQLVSSAAVFVRILFKNRLTGVAFVFIVVLVALAVFAPWVAPYPEQGRGSANLSETLQPPSARHLFGTDDMGRDLLSRVIFGARISLVISTVTILVALVVAIPLGIVAGYFGGMIDEVIMRVTDVFLSFPPLLIAIVVASFLGPSLTNAMIAIVIAWWPWYTRLVRSQVMSYRERPFVLASRCIGTNRWSIMFGHIMPNTIAPIIIQASIDMGGVILTAASLSFIGLGAQPPIPEWGLIISTARQYIIDNWWYTTFPGLFIFATVLSFNLLGDGLREVMDPKTRVR